MEGESWKSCLFLIFLTEMFADDYMSDHMTSACLNTVITPTSLLFMVIRHNLKCLSDTKRDHKPKKASKKCLIKWWHTRVACSTSNVQTRVNYKHIFVCIWSLQSCPSAHIVHVISRTHMLFHGEEGQRGRVCARHSQPSISIIKPAA